MAKTLAELLTTLRQEILHEYVEDKWSDALLTTFLNRAQTKVARLLNAEFTIDNTADSVSGTQEYTLPNGFLRLYPSKRAVSYTDAAGDIKYPVRTSIDALIEQYGNDYATDSGTPTEYYIRENNKIGFYPVPNYNGTNNIFIYYYGEPADMSDTVSCSLPDVTELAMCYWAAKLAWDNQNTPLNATVTQTIQMLVANFNSALEEVGVTSDFINPVKMNYTKREDHSDNEHTIR